MSKRDSTDTPSNGFSESWLTLREPADHAARNPAILEQLKRWAEPRDKLKIMDLGAGTGSNFRYLAPHLGHHQHWVLVDNDAHLLEQLPHHLSAWASHQHAGIKQHDESLHLSADTFSATVSRRMVDIASDIAILPFDSVNLVTASALLDLASNNWLKSLCVRCADTATLFALNYNGKIKWHPESDDDELITARLNQHQLGDKGFGPAAGPQAGAVFTQCMASLQRKVFCEDSDWIIDQSASELQLSILHGWAEAVKELKLDSAALVEHWQKQRLAAIDQQASALTVGHVDLFCP
ncbi:MAG: class I SAM-dependent methyltransferase [Granulosicoccus sp.]